MRRGPSLGDPEKPLILFPFPLKSLSGFGALPRANIHVRPDDRATRSGRRGEAAPRPYDAVSLWRVRPCEIVQPTRWRHRQGFQPKSFKVQSGLLLLTLLFFTSLFARAQLRPEVTPQPKQPSAAKLAQIVIQTSPEAQVYLDDVFKGQTSAQGRLIIENPKPGDHTLRITLAGKKDYEQQVKVVGGQTVNIQAALADLAGSIRVQTSPGAAIYLDDSSRGTADSTGRLSIPNVAVGSHELRISAPGKRDYRQDIAVSPGQEAKFEASLTDLAGTLVLQTSPGATVFLNDSVRGAADSSGQLSIGEVAAGPYVLRVVAPRKTEYRQNITVSPGQSVRMVANLPDSGSTPEERALWKSMENSNNPADFQSYLDQFPNGEFAAMAKRRLNSLRAAASLDEDLQQKVAWLTQQVSAYGRTSFYFLYWQVKNPFSSKANENHPRGPMGTITASVGGVHDCTLRLTEFVERPSNAALYEQQTNNSIDIPLAKIDESQIRAVNVTDQRDVNGYNGYNGWLVFLPALPGSNALSLLQQSRSGKHLENSSSNTINLGTYILIVNDPNASAKAVEVLRSMVRACSSTPLK